MTGNPLDSDGAVVEFFEDVTGIRDGYCYFLAGSGFECGNSHDRCLVIREDPDVSSLSCTSAELEGMLCCLSDSIDVTRLKGYRIPVLQRYMNEITYKNDYRLQPNAVEKIGNRNPAQTTDPGRSYLKAKRKYSSISMNGRPNPKVRN